MFNFPGQSTKSPYPPVYVHDVSFWCEGDQFDEMKLKEIVTRETENIAESVSCIDTFRPADSSNRVSYCYRILYYSRQQALLKTKARYLQLKLRETIQQELKIILR